MSERTDLTENGGGGLSVHIKAIESLVQHGFELELPEK